MVSFGAARQGEPGKNRPAIVLSSNHLNSDHPRDLIVVVPLSTSTTESDMRPELRDVGGLDRQSRAICLGVRGVARARLLERLGEVTGASLAEIERALALILGLRT